MGIAMDKELLSFEEFYISFEDLEKASEIEFGGMGTTSTKAGCTTGAGGC
jgi:hypothetical protein